MAFISWGREGSGEGVLIRVTAVPFLCGTPLATIDVFPVPTFPYCHHCLFYHRHIPNIISYGSTKMPLNVYNSSLFSPPLPPMPLICFPLWMNVVDFASLICSSAVDPCTFGRDRGIPVWLFPPHHRVARQHVLSWSKTCCLQSGSMLPAEPVWFL